MKKAVDFSRRQAIFAVAGGLPLMALALSQAYAQAAKPTTELKEVPADDPVAKAIGYVSDATKGQRVLKGKTEGKDQVCSNCQLYTKQGEVKGKELGKCVMIASGLVVGKGWCKSWAPKA